MADVTTELRGALLSQTPEDVEALMPLLALQYGMKGALDRLEAEMSKLPPELEGWWQAWLDNNFPV